MLDLLYMISISGSELYLGDLIKYTFFIGLLCSDTYEPISLKFGMMLDMAKLSRYLELVQSSKSKVAWSR